MNNDPKNLEEMAEQINELNKAGGLAHKRVDLNIFERVVERFKRSTDVIKSAAEELDLPVRRVGQPITPSPEEVRRIDKKRRARKLVNQRRRQNVRRLIQNRK